MVNTILVPYHALLGEGEGMEEERKFSGLYPEPDIEGQMC
jgi:hypothetical protein